MDDLFPNLYADKKPESNLGFMDVLGKAFKLENDVVNLYDYVTRPAFESDPNFDYERSWQEQKLPLEWKPILAQSVSEADFQARLGRIREEEQNKAILAAAGWGGTFAAMAAGMLSPTALIPVAGAGARGTNAVAQSFALAGLGASASEAALLLNQETRTGAEAATSIGINTALGGIMGVGFLSLEGKLRQKMVREFPIKNEQLTIETRNEAGEVVREMMPNPQARIDDSQPIYAMDEIVPAVKADHVAVRQGMETASIPVRAADISYPQVAAVELPDITAGQLRAAPLVLEQMQQVPQSAQAVAREWVRTTYGEPTLATIEASSNGVEGFLEKLAKAYQDSDLRALDVEMKGRTGQVQPSDMVAIKSEAAIPNAPTKGLSAQAAPTSVRNTAGLRRPSNRLAAAAYDALGKLNPLTRTANNRLSPRTRDNALKLSTAGQLQDNLLTAGPSANGGPIEARIRLHDAAMSKLFAALDDAYVLHIYGKAEFDAGKRSALVAQLRSHLIGVPPGKLKYAEFGEAVYNALSTGKTDVPEAKLGANALREFFAYYNKTHKDYLAERWLVDPEAGPMYKELAPEDFEEGVVDYAHQIWDSAKIKQNSAEFLNEFADRANAALREEFARANERHQAKLAEMENDLLFAQLTPAEQRSRYEEILGEIDTYSEMPEYYTVRDQLSELRKQAREEGWDKEQLKAQVKDLEDNAPQTYKDILKHRKEAQALARNLRKLGGAALSDAEKARTEANAVEESLYHTLERMANKVSLIQFKAVKQGTALSNKLAGARGTLAKAIETLEQRNNNLVALVNSRRKNPVSRAKAEELLAKSQARVKKLREDLDLASGKAVADEVALSRLMLLRSDVMRETRDVMRARFARLEDLETKASSAEEKILTQEEKSELISKMKEDIGKRAAEFDSRWSEKGAVWELDENGVPSFAERALELATDFQQRLIGDGDLRPAGISIIGAERGPQLRRLLKLPYEQKSKWLIKDPETVARAFDRQMAPDLEIWREFGSVNGGKMFTDLDQDIRQIQLELTNATHVRLPKEWRLKARLLGEKVKNDLAAPDDGLDFFLSADDFSKESKNGYELITPKLRNDLNEFIAVQHRKLTRDLGVMVQRLRKQRMVPQDSSSFMWRTGRMIKDWNVITMMGKAMISSFPDIARPVFKYGIQKTFGKSWLPMITGIKNSAKGKSFRVYNKELNRRLAVSLDSQLHSRANAVFDLAYDKASGLTLPERATRFMSNKMGLVAMFDLWTDGMKNMAGAVVHATMSEYVPVVGRSIMSQLLAGKEVTPPKGMENQFLYLYRLGLRNDDIVKIAQQMEQPGAMEVFQNNARLPNLDKWTDRQAFRAYGAAVQQEVGDLIIVPGVDRPNWHDENMAYSMLAQFQSYTFSATNRIVMSGLQGNDPYLLQGVALSIAFGAVSYYTNAMVMGDKAWEKAAKRDASGVLYEAIDRSGVLGAMSIGTRLGEQLPYTSDLAIFGGEEQKYRRPSGLYGSIFGPTAGQVEKVADILVNIDDEGQRDRLLKRIHSLLPYNNVFSYQAAVSRLGE